MLLKHFHVSSILHFEMYINSLNVECKRGGGGSHMRPHMDFHLVLHGEYL